MGETHGKRVPEVNPTTPKVVELHFAALALSLFQQPNHFELSLISQFDGHTANLQPLPNLRISSTKKTTTLTSCGFGK